MAGRLLWQVPVSQIGVIGEYTNEGGPWGDDWFVVFVRQDGNWFEAPADLLHVEAVLKVLGDELQSSLDLALANSTTFKSRVIWPLSLKGQPLLSCRSVTPRDWILGFPWASPD